MVTLFMFFYREFFWNEYISIYKLGDVGVACNLISSLYLTTGLPGVKQLSAPVLW